MAARQNASSRKSKFTTAKLFQNGRSQAVRTPMEFRFEGKEVRIRRTRTGVLLEPIETTAARDLDRWFADLDRYNSIAGEFMPEGRRQPDMPQLTSSIELPARHQRLRRSHAQPQVRGRKSVPHRDLRTPNCLDLYRRTL